MLPGRTDARNVDKLDEADERSESVARAAACGYASVRECATLAEVAACLADPALVPLGGIRADPAGRRVFAYFGVRAGGGP